MRFKSIVNEKVASATTPAKSEAAPAKSNLTAAMNDLISTLDTTKVASEAPVPESDLRKVANEVISADRDKTAAEARLYGTAMADGFVSRLQDYENAASAAGVKTAAEQLPADVIELAKLAYEDPGLFLRSVQEGYAAQQASMQKTAEDTYAEHYNATVEWIHKTASEHYLAGAGAIEQALQGA